jgi:putative ABC transport system permease protein
MSIPLRYNLRNLYIRKTTTALTTLGVAMVVLIFVALSSLVQGLRSTISETGIPDNVVVLSQGAISIPTSVLERSVIQEIKYLPEVRKNGQGEPLASPELMVEDELYYEKLGQSFPTPVRGVYPVAFEVHNDVRIEQGSTPQPNGGIIMGRKIAEQLGGIQIGDELQIGPRAWTVVGIFSANGNILESEVWTYLDDLAVATRKNRISAMGLKVEDGVAAATVARRLNDDPRLKVKAMAETDYFGGQTQDAQRVWALTLTVSFILGLAAIFGGMNTMYAAVANRIREIGILRALGFSHRSVMLSFTLECVILALIGGAVGSLIALAINGVSMNTMAAGRFVNFSFEITPTILLRGVLLSVIIGVIGGFFPARKAAKLQIIEAIRSQ